MRFCSTDLKTLRSVVQYGEDTVIQEKELAGSSKGCIRIVIQRRERQGFGKVTRISETQDKK